MKFIKSLGPFRQFLAVCSFVLMVFAMQAKGLSQSELAADRMMVYVSSSLAPIFLFLLLFDVLMNRVQIADKEGEERENYRCYIRLDLIVGLLLVLSWSPFFISLLS